MTGMNVVYISYSGADRVHAGPLIEALQRSGCEVFDPQRSEGEADGITTENFERANVIIVLWSKHAEKSDAVKRELRFAQDWDKKVILVLLEMITPPRSLALTQHTIIDVHSRPGWIAAVVDRVWPLGAAPWD